MSPAGPKGRPAFGPYGPPVGAGEQAKREDSVADFLFKKEALPELFAALKENEFRIVAPIKEKDLVLFAEVKQPEQITFDYINPVNSAKEFLFPPTEEVFGYRLRAQEVHLVERSVATPVAAKTAILGLRPCDAAAFPLLDKAFTWECEDTSYLTRRKNALLLTFGCSEADQFCFCTSLGLTPESDKGSDIIFTPLASGDFKVEAVGQRGQALFSKIKGVFEEGEAGETRVAEVPQRFDLSAIKAWLDENFEHPFWQEISLACLGCGVCTYLSPTCHCFDMVDEANYSGGSRRKNWDACAFGNFTLQASGLNPRPTSGERWRQRLMHKFKYYPDKFDGILCTGCGRCVRHCPVQMGLLETLVKISDMSQT